MSVNKFIVEGVDRLGKGTLIDGIQHRLGYHTVIHFEKPKLLDVYDGLASAATSDLQNTLQIYQKKSFINMFDLLWSDAKIIFDRSHLGEYVYGPMYRGYNADYIFELEETNGAKNLLNTKLILLTEDFTVSQHFVDDGKSLGSIDARQREQDLFMQAFELSEFENKKIICVTDPETGMFKSKDAVLDMVLK
jgi:thymidylate kinase